MHLEACLRPSQLFHSSSRTLSRSSCNVCLLWSFHQQFFCYWCVHDRPTEICHSSQPLVLVYLPVHWVLFLFETVSPQAARCVTFPLVTPSCRLHFSLLRTVAQFLNTDFSYEHHCTFNLCSDLPWIQQRFFFSLDLTRIRIRLFSSSKHQCQFDTILRAPYLREDVPRLPQLRLGPVLITCSHLCCRSFNSHVNHSREPLSTVYYSQTVSHSQPCVSFAALCLIRNSHVNCSRPSCDLDSHASPCCLIRSSHVSCSQSHLFLNSHASLSLFGCLNVAFTDELAVPSTM